MKFNAMKTGVAAASCPALPLALSGPAHAITPKPGTGASGKAKTAKSACSWSLAADGPRAGQVYVAVKFRTDRTGAIFPVMWTVRDDSVGLPTDNIAFQASLRQASGTTQLFSGTMPGRETRSGTPTAVRVLPGDKITYEMSVTDGDYIDFGGSTCTGTNTVPRMAKR